MGGADVREADRGRDMEAAVALWVPFQVRWQAGKFLGSGLTYSTTAQELSPCFEYGDVLGPRPRALHTLSSLNLHPAGCT